jgi:hypothetical protein
VDVGIVFPSGSHADGAVRDGFTVVPRAIDADIDGFDLRADPGPVLVRPLGSEVGQMAIRVEQGLETAV